MKYQMANADGSRPSKCPECGQDLRHFDGDRCPACNSLLEIIEPDLPSISKILQWLDEQDHTREARKQLVEQNPTGSWRTLPDSKEHGRITIEFFNDKSALVTWANGKALQLVLQRTETPTCYRLVRYRDESFETQSDECLGIRFELKAEGVAIFTYGNREHFRMVPGRIDD